ncbi:MAG: thermonuclease family protein [Bdellovibrionales bacterium]|nr:thermonuclease family protein [Bdellovibrionales bacterium]
MRILICLVRLHLGLGLFFYFPTHGDTCVHQETAFHCVKYIKNYDGDTITVDIPNVHPLLGKHISVRIRHIDSPEVKGDLPCEKDKARRAKNLVENLLKRAKKIDLVNVAKDKYFRILADVMVDNVSLKDVLIKNHLAYHYEGGTKQKNNWCERLPANLSL